MMTREHHRRRSPESERRRRKSRRDSRELLENQQMPVPAPYDIRNTEIINTRPRKPSTSNSDSDLSLSPSSSSTTSSLLNISRKEKWGFGSFFSSTSTKQRQNKVRKKRSKKRFFRFGNSSSSSTNSDLAYGKGYIDRPETAAPKREQTDEEILELGRKFAEMARLQNNEDLRAAGRHRPSALVGAAAALSHFHRTNSGHRLDRGHGSSKPSHKYSEDEDSEWESASEDEEESSEDDLGLAYGSNVNLPTQPQQPVQKNNQSELSIPPELERPLHRKPSIVDPPAVRTRELVAWHCPNPLRVDRSTVEDTHGLPVAPSETVSFEGRPLQEVYPMPIPDPSRYDAGRGSIVSAIQESGRSRRDPRPEPVPIQQPKPIVPVSSKLYNTTEPDAREYRDSQRTSSSGKGITGVAAATIAGAALAGALANERKEDLDRKEERDRRREARREERRREERRVEDRVDLEREEKLREERRRELLAEQEREEKRREERCREERLEQEREEKRRSKQTNTNSRSEKAEKRRNKDDHKDDRSEKRREKKTSEADRDNDRERRRRERHRDDAPYTSASANANDERRDREDKPDRKDALKDEIREGKRASRSTDLDSYRRVEDPTYPSSGGPIDPFQFQVADDAFQTPKNATTPNRPLTPNVVFVEREPDFSRFELTEADTKPQERLSRRDSYERELEHAKEVYKEAKHATAPVEPTGMAAAMAAVEEERRGRNRRRGGDSTSRTRSRHDTPPRDAILEAADRYYRQQVIAQQIVEDHVREATPERSVVDKWQEEPEIEIVAPPEQDEKPKTKSPYEAPNADVRIDNVLSPKEIVQPDGRFRKPRLVRDPSAERGRPMLNIVRPTPDPSPMTQERKPESESTKVATEVPQTSSRATPDVVIGPRGDVVQAPVMPSKAVSWGENETKHYVLEDPVRDRSSDSGRKVVMPAETPKPRLSRKGKSGGWDILAAAAAPAVASTISDSAIDVTEPETKRAKDPPKGKQRSPFSFEEFGDEPPAIGPKPSGPRSKQMPGSFADDLDFTATVAAGLQDSGFDPNLVIDNAGYHKRQSPPPGTYRTPFAETVPDLGIYAVPAMDPVAAEQRGFVIGELPETPAAEKDIPTGKSDFYSQVDKKERNGEEKAPKQSKYDRSEIVVIEDEPTKSSRSVDEGTSSSQSPVLSKKDQKRQDKAAKAKAMEEEELASTVSLKESEFSDSPSKKKSKKSKKAVVIYEEAAPATEADGRTSNAKPVDDEWDAPKKDKGRGVALIHRNVPEPKQIDERDLPQQSNKSKRGTIATDTLTWSKPVSEIREPPSRRRTVDEFSSFELTEEPEDLDLSEKPKTSRRESSKYDSPSRAPSVADDIVDSPKEMSSSFSDLRDLKGSAPGDEFGTPKKSKKKRSKRNSDLFDTPWVPQLCLAPSRLLKRHPSLIDIAPRGTPVQAHCHAPLRHLKVLLSPPGIGPQGSLVLVHCPAQK
ncbi:hypothetical protein PG997_004789 [Apiospora hydei]|uniref:Involucrin repeat protein n=1 Tax=Apiospora hydei TaxID=1337664 RepID=A0ABR1X336_9PEZI